MEQNERTPRSPEQERTRRISLFQEDERTQRVESPPTTLRAAPDSGAQARGKGGRHGKHGRRSAQRWPTILVTGLIGLVVGVIAALLVTGTMLQREIAGRDIRIAQMASELDQARTEHQAASARGTELDQRKAVLDQRERQLDRRENALDQRERQIDRREHARVPLPDVTLPEGGLGRGILDRLGQRIQDLIDETVPSRLENSPSQAAR